jgi:hypothetical protein
MPKPGAGLDPQTLALLRSSELLIARSTALAAYSSKVSKALHEILQRSERVVRASRRAHRRPADDLDQD